MTRRALSHLVRLRSPSGRIRPALTVAVVAALVGLLFATSAQLGRAESGERRPTNLAALVQSESDRVTRLTEEVDTLRGEVDTLAAGAPVVAVEDAAVVQREGAVVGTIPVSGPGLRVQLDDAPPANISIPGVTVDDLVVHQQDLQHVINALWAGGAEAMTLQGERVIMTSAFRCSGNILLLHGKVFSPPYVIEVVGDTRGMRQALDAAPGVQRYLEWVQTVGLGWNVRDEAELSLPAYTGSSELQFAQLPEDVSPFR